MLFVWRMFATYDGKSEERTKRVEDRVDRKMGDVEDRLEAQRTTIETIGRDVYYLRGGQDNRDKQELKDAARDGKIAPYKEFDKVH